VTDGGLDDRGIDLVTEEKKQIIRESEALEFFSVTQTPDDVGGLGVLKDWLRPARTRFHPGSAQLWPACAQRHRPDRYPRHRQKPDRQNDRRFVAYPFDSPGRRFVICSLVGESEERARRALRLAETVAPCILWIDEMEKALAHGGLDAGTSHACVWRHLNLDAGEDFSGFRGGHCQRYHQSAA